MPAPALVKPTHKAIQTYYQALQAYREHFVGHETAVRSAFQNLLADTAKARHWLLVPEKSLRVGSKEIIPDGTLCDEYNLHRGYWEAKDTDDKLDAEIAKKIKKGYPLSNTVFEDTRQAVLFQGQHEGLRVDLTDAKKLADLLNLLFSYTEPDHEDFEKAVADFKDRVKDIGLGLDAKIKEAHANNKKFQSAFESFFGLCQTALNPNISPTAVDEMLVQHLLTERLIRKVFDNPDFTRQNVIAAEVEKVIDALVSKSFNRDEFQKSLDVFYKAIENAAHTLPEFSDKQHFLNTVYERFFQGYSVKTADTHGIVYTPQAIVDFMCASVAEVLQTEFGKNLGDPGVNILDPCTGTGNFIVNLLRRIPKKDLPRMYKEQLFANEVMLLPYYIAALNIEHAYYELTEQYEPFEGLCFVDTLDLAEGEQKHFSFMTEKNTERVERQKKAPITVIVGNPPYNYRQVNENDNNKNRKYPELDIRITKTYARDSEATNRNALSDAYIRFIRWAVDRLEGRDGIVCFVTNNSFVSQVAFDGMRKHLFQDFTQVYHVDLHGDVRKNPKLSGTTHNVFGIQVGVGITVAVRTSSGEKRRLLYWRVPEEWRKDQKLAWLQERNNISGIGWRDLKPDQANTWLIPENAEAFALFVSIGEKFRSKSGVSRVGAIFETYCLGVTTARDDFVYGFERSQLADRLKEFIDAYNGEVDRYRRAGNPSDVDSFVRYDKIKWSRDLKLDLKRAKYATYTESKIHWSLYRPFTKKYLFHDRILNEEAREFSRIYPTQTAESENPAICVPNIGGRTGHWTIITNCIVHYALNSLDATQCFPFYTYDEDGTNRRENITDWALQQFREHYGDPTIGKWDIFHYVYGVLHHPGYRAKFADNLKRELPRIPFAPDFRAFVKAGEELARLHLDYEKLEPYELKWLETPGVPLYYRIEDKMRLSKDKTTLKVNPSLTLAGIPPKVFEYRLGNRSALEWIIDQYQVSEDKRSGIRSDPNRRDDEQYIVRLVGQVVRVSLETVRIVKGLPERYGD